MTAAELALWRRVNERARLLSPDFARELLARWKLLAESWSEAQMERMIATGSVDRIVDTFFSDQMLDMAMSPVREQIRRSVVDGASHFIRYDIPRPPPLKAGSLGFAFDSLSPFVVPSIIQLESRVMTNLKTEIRETVRQSVRRGLEAGVAPRTISRELRPIIGIAPNQEQAVFNFKRMLESGDREALTRELRDKRFDSTLNRLLGKNGDGLSPAQVEKMTEAYRKSMLAFHADTIAKEASLDTNRLAQRLSWQDAIDKGIVDGAKVIKTRIVILDGRERPEHHALSGQVRKFNEPYGNGEMVSGDNSYGCRCIDRYSLTQ